MFCCIEMWQNDQKKIFKHKSWWYQKKKITEKCYRNITLHKIIHKVNDVVFVLLSKDLCVLDMNDFEHQLLWYLDSAGYIDSWHKLIVFY